MAPRGENTVVVQGLHVKLHEAFTGKTNTANVHTDIQLAKVKVGQLTCQYCLHTKQATNVMKRGDCDNWDDRVWIKHKRPTEI